ncbi:MAG: hypothetical protein ACK4NW_03885 [Roseinatronobacter sp.]
MKISLIRHFTKGLAFSVVFAGSLMAPNAADARVEFQGGGSVYDFSGCEAYGWQGTSTVKARFRPGGLPGNGPNTRMSMFWDTFAMVLRTRGEPLTSSFIEVDGAGVGSDLNIYSNERQGENFSQVRITRQQPNNITASTDVVRLEGIIRHFDGLRGCTARFEFLMRQR